MNVDARARALAFCRRVRAAVDRSRALALQTGAYAVQAARNVARLLLPPQPIARPRRQRQKVAPPQPARPSSGRVVRRSPRRRQAAARETADGSSDGADGATRPRRPAWAQATVFAERVAYDGKGHEWRVRELDATGIPGARRPRCLVFENHALVRRLWRYPAEWMKCSDAALLALAERKP